MPRTRSGMDTNSDEGDFGRQEGKRQETVLERKEILCAELKAKIGLSIHPRALLQEMCAKLGNLYGLDDFQQATYQEYLMISEDIERIANSVIGDVQEFDLSTSEGVSARDKHEERKDAAAYIRRVVLSARRKQANDFAAREGIWKNVNSDSEPATPVLNQRVDTNMPLREISRLMGYLFGMSMLELPEKARDVAVESTSSIHEKWIEKFLKAVGEDWGIEQFKFSRDSQKEN